MPRVTQTIYIKINEKLNFGKAIYTLDTALRFWKWNPQLFLCYRSFVGDSPNLGGDMRLFVSHMAVSRDDTAPSPNGRRTPASSSSLSCSRSFAQSSRSDSRASALCWTMFRWSHSAGALSVCANFSVLIGDDSSVIVVSPEPGFGTWYERGFTSFLSSCTTPIVNSSFGIAASLGFWFEALTGASSFTLLVLIALRRMVESVVSIKFSSSCWNDKTSLLCGSLFLASRSTGICRIKASWVPMVDASEKFVELSLPSTVWSAAVSSVPLDPLAFTVRFLPVLGFFDCLSPRLLLVGFTGRYIGEQLQDSARYGCRCGCLNNSPACKFFRECYTCVGAFGWNS